MKKFLIIALLISLNAFSISYEKIGEWGFGKYQQIAMKGDIVYGISKQSGISVIDYSDVNNPVRLGEFSRTDEFHNMLIEGDTGFISAEGKVYITDVSNNIPETISVIDLDADCYRMAISDNKLYVAGGSAGLIVLDVSDLEHPSVLGSYFDSDNMKDVVDVAVNSNGDIYVIDKEKGLFILKTSDFQTYEQIGRMSGQMFRVKFLSDTEIVLSYGQNGLRFYNCENPDSLKYLSQYTQVNFISDFVVDGDTIFCADNHNGLLVLDISKIESPSLIKNVVIPAVCYAIEKKDNYIFSVNGTGGVLCLDISDPTNVSQVSSFDDVSYCLDMAYFNGKLLLADFYNGIKSLSTENISHMELLDLKRGEGYPSALTLKDNYIYYADSTKGIGVLKINEDGTLSDVNYLELEGNFLSIATYGNYLIAAGEYGGLYLFDISDRENPQLLDRVYRYQSVVNVNVSGSGVIVVSAGFNGVKLCSIEDGELVELNSIDVDGYAQDALLLNGNLFVADFYNGLWLDKVDEDFQVTESGLYLEGETPESLFSAGNYLYVASGSNGLYVFNLTGKSPEQVAYIETHSNVKDMFVNDNVLYIAEGLSGKVDVYLIVADGTKVYTAPLNNSREIEIRNNCAKRSLVNVVVYRNLKPIQFERVILEGKAKSSIFLKNGDVIKCISASNNISIRLFPDVPGKDELSLTLSNTTANMMRGNIEPDSFFQRISIENVSDSNGYFSILFFDGNGKLVSQRKVFVEAGDSRDFNFMFLGCYSVEVRGESKFTATLFQSGIFSRKLNYLQPVRLELY